ncbi:MAG: alanine racemase [Elusimicrobiales bacterium]|nr:alanine racemase [Elusimicrobiales bacterium]
MSVTVASLDAARGVASAAARLGKTARCHIKVDTGMGRIGSRRPGAVKIAQFLADSPSAEIEGIYTHFSSPDSDQAFTRRQLKRFNDTLADCAALGLKTGLRHAASSYPAVHIPESRFDMVRPGLAVYGLLDGFQPALSLKTRIVFLKDARSGASISYCRSFRARKPMRVATIPVGYGDGYARRLSKRGAALVNGARARILGNVTMDMTMIDVTDVPGAEVGGEAVLIGEQNGERISAQDIAALAGTISYETVTALAARVPRLYTK